MLKRINPTETKAWNKLQSHFNDIESQHMKDMFAADANRFKQFSIQHEGVLLDYSKNRINQTTLDLLIDLAKECDLRDGIEQLFSGAEINATEQRAALHTAL